MEWSVGPSLAAGPLRDGKLRHGDKRVCDWILAVADYAADAEQFCSV